MRDIVGDSIEELRYKGDRKVYISYIIVQHRGRLPRC